MSTAAGRSWLPLLVAVAATVLGLVVTINVAGTSSDGGSGGSGGSGIAGPAATTGPSTTSPATAASSSPPTTATPSATASTLPGGVVLGQSCANPGYGYQLRYPDGWHAELTFSGWECALFDPQPFTVTPQSEIPPVAVVVSVAAFTFNSSVAQYTDPGAYQLFSRVDLTVDGQPAVAVEVATIGSNSPLPAGTMRYAVLVDWGQKTFLIETNSADADDYAIAKHVVRGMAESMHRAQ